MNNYYHVVIETPDATLSKKGGGSSTGFTPSPIIRDTKELVIFFKEDSKPS